MHKTDLGDLLRKFPENLPVGSSRMHKNYSQKLSDDLSALDPPTWFDDLSALDPPTWFPRIFEIVLQVHQFPFVGPTPNTCSLSCQNHLLYRRINLSPMSQCPYPYPTPPLPIPHPPPYTQTPPPIVMFPF